MHEIWRITARTGRIVLWLYDDRGMQDARNIKNWSEPLIAAALERGWKPMKQTRRIPTTFVLHFLYLSILLVSCGPRLVDVSMPQIPTKLDNTYGETIPLSVRVRRWGKAELKWYASAGAGAADVYAIYRSGSLIRVVGFRKTRQKGVMISVRDKGLAPDTRYCYAVVAYDAAGNGAGQTPVLCVNTRTTTKNCLGCVGDGLWIVTGICLRLPS